MDKEMFRRIKTRLDREVADWPDYFAEKVIRTVLTAAREPTDDMLLKSGYRPAYADEAWKAMIDAALSQ